MDLLIALAISTFQPTLTPTTATHTVTAICANAADAPRTQQRFRRADASANAIAPTTDQTPTTTDDTYRGGGRRE